MARGDIVQPGDLATLVRAAMAWNEPDGTKNFFLPVGEVVMVIHTGVSFVEVLTSLGLGRVLYDAVRRLA